MKERLKIGIILDDPKVPNWVLSIIEELSASNYASIPVLLHCHYTAGKTNRFFFNSYKFWVYRALKKFEELIFKSEPNAFQVKNLTSVSSNIDTVHVALPNRVEVLDLPENTINQLQHYDLDIILYTGFTPLKGRILQISRHGIWCCRVGSQHLTIDNAPIVWEVLEAKNEIPLSIIQKNINGELLVHHSYTAMDEEFSILRMQNRLSWKAALLLPRKLRELYEQGEVQFYNDKKFISGEMGDGASSFPSNFDVLRLASLLYFNKVWLKLKNLFFFEQWILLYKFGDSTVSSKVLSQFKKLIPPKNCFWADPFVVQQNGRYFLFFEELLYDRGLGHISYLEIDKAGNLSKPRKILETPYHLSYPFIFEYEEQFYMIPETCQNQTIELYRCTAFPDKWEWAHNIMEGVSALDTTIHFQDGIYWLFTNIRESEEVANEELYLFFADDILSKTWTPHPMNPVVSDVRKARPAGKLFQNDDGLFRPAQDCSKTYGYGMCINQVTKLSKKEYEERTIDVIFPNWEKNLTATHSLNSSGNLTVIDAMINRSKFSFL